MKLELVKPDIHPRQERNDEIAARLETMAKMLRSGEFEADGIAIAVALPDGAIGTEYDMGSSLWVLLGAVDLLKKRLLDAAE
jgi:hypothetical protein